jgi:hypothetical protein
VHPKVSRSVDGSIGLEIPLASVATVSVGRVGDPAGRSSVASGAVAVKEPSVGEDTVPGMQLPLPACAVGQNATDVTPPRS